MATIMAEEDNFSVNSIVNEIAKHDYATELKEWTLLARYLNISPIDVNILANDLLLNKRGYHDVFPELLHKWKSTQGSKATLPRLLEILQHKCKWNNMAERLRNAFQTKTDENECSISKKIPKRSKFITPPQYWLEFLQDKQLNVLILRSQSIQLTLDRISDTVADATVLSSPEDLLLKMVSYIPAITQQQVFVVVSEENTERLLIHLADIHFKCVVITSEACSSESNSQKQVDEKFAWQDLTPVLKNEIIDGYKPHTALTVKECIQMLSEISFETLLLLALGEVPISFKDNMPEPIPYYIPRRLVTRNILTEKILSCEGRDIYFTHGIERHQLSKLSGGKSTDTSGHLISNGFSHSTKYVVLESKTHYEQISKRYVDRPMHLIDYDNGKFIWKKSNGGLHSIQQAVCDDQDFLSEEDLITKYQNESHSCETICISDAPGMGKSILLAKIAREMRQNTNPWAVCFVIASEFVKEAKRLKNIVDKPKLIAKVLAICVCENELSASCFPNYINNVKDILMDGFDELDAEDIQYGYELLRCIRVTFSKSRLWVTTRPHLFFELEKVLNTVGYNIMPFGEHDQVRFFELFWSRGKNTKVDINKLSIFADKCLSSIKQKIDNKSEHDISGIPLQCLLIGEVYEEDAMNFVSSEECSLPVFSINSLTDLYEQLVKKKYEKFYNRYDKRDLGYLELTKAHTSLALLLLFPSYIKKLNNILGNQLNLQEIFNVGILESKNVLPVPRFIHRTFAEYFLAKFMVEIITTRFNRHLIDLLILRVLKTVNADSKRKKKGMNIKTRQFKHNVICYFIDSLLKQHDSKIYLDSNRSIKTLKAQTVANISEACAYSDFESIFFKVVNQLTSFGTAPINILTVTLLFLCTIHSGISMTRRVFEEFESIASEPVVYSDMRFDSRSLLHFAVARGNYSILEFIVNLPEFRELLQNKNDSFRTMIYECVQNSKNKSEADIQDKISIVNCLVEINENLLALQDDMSTQKTYCTDIHVKLLCELFRLGKNIYNIDTTTDFLRVSTKSYNCEEYMLILECIKIQFPQFDINNILSSRFSPTKTILQKICKNTACPVGFRVLDLLQNTMSSAKISFMKWQWLVRCKGVSYSTFIECADILVNEIETLHNVDSKGFTFTHHAIAESNEIALRYLHFQRAEDISFTDADKTSPTNALQKVNEYQNTLCCRTNLEQNNIRKIEELLILACKKSELNTIKILCDWYSEVTKRPVKNIKIENEGRRSTILDVVLLRRDEDILEYFVKDHQCTEVLQFTIQDLKLSKWPEMENNKIKFCKLAAKLMADKVSIPDENGLVPLSTKGLWYSYIKPLVEAGADVNFVDSTGYSPLHWALMHPNYNDSSVVEELIKCGADVNAETAKLETPLTLTLKMDNPYTMVNCITALINGNADIRRQDSFGDTFLHILPSKLKDYYFKREDQFHKVVDCIVKNGLGDVLHLPGKDNLTPIQVTQRSLKVLPRTLELLKKNNINI